MNAKNEKVNSGVTNKDYWDSTYLNKNLHQLLPLDGYKFYCNKLIMDKIKEFYNGGDIIEVGAGGSDWLIRIVKQLKPNYCAGLDYSERGCQLLEVKSKVNNVKIDVIHADMFSPPAHLKKKFDFTISFGVVEHFKNLSEVLGAVSQFSKPGGLIFSLIPNMAGIYGVLTRLWNRDVYDMHIPHDLHSFIDGHHAAGLDTLWCNYLGSSNFSMISSCFQKRKGINYFIYKQLTRISKMLWMIESKIKPFPATKIFSPYILVVSRVPE